MRTLLVNHCGRQALATRSARRSCAKKAYGRRNQGRSMKSADRATSPARLQFPNLSDSEAARPIRPFFDAPNNLGLGCLLMALSRRAWVANRRLLFEAKQT